MVCLLATDGASGTLTCLPLCILFLLRTGVLPVVTHTPARVLLYTSFSSMTPCPFSCCGTQSHGASLLRFRVCLTRRDAARRDAATRT